MLPMLIKMLDKTVDKLGHATVNRILCRMGSHQWEAVEEHKFLRICLRCGVVDDIRTTGIDGLPKRRKRKLRKKIFRSIKSKSNK